MVSVDVAPNFLGIVLSTITSPLPLNIVITYRESCVGYSVDRSLRSLEEPFRARRVSADSKAIKILHHRKRFEMFHEMYMAQGFRLILCADVHDCIVERAIQALECIVEAEKGDGELDYLLCEPSVISEMRLPRTRVRDPRVGWTGTSTIYTSAL